MPSSLSLRFLESYQRDESDLQWHIAGPLSYWLFLPYPACCLPISSPYSDLPRNPPLRPRPPLSSYPHRRRISGPETSLNTCPNPAQRRLRIKRLPAYAHRGANTSKTLYNRTRLTP